MIKQDVKVAILKEDNVAFLSSIGTWMALHMQYREGTIFLLFIHVFILNVGVCSL